MSVVWKYQLDVKQNQLVYMPRDARILSVGVDNDFPVVWVLTKGKGVEVEPNVFSVVTTGEIFETDSRAYTPDELFLGTVTLGKDMASGKPSAWYVAHIFKAGLHIKDNKLQDRQEITEELRNA